MNYFILAVLVCTAPGECHWQHKGTFLREEACHAVGQYFMRNKLVNGYRCVMQISAAAE